MSTLEGARLVCVNEAKTDSLDFPLLKTLSGGDRLNGAGMRENARQIPPTWKVFLVSNDQPVFPADPAFRGRVHLVPFKADFSQNPEVTIDKTLQAELPGILAELIALSPSVIRDGLPKTGAVREATESLFSELDTAARFQADCLEAAPDEAVSLGDMRSAAEHWMRVEGVEDDLQRFMGELRKRMPKQYGFRTIEGVKTRVYTNVKLRDDSPHPRPSGVIVSA